MKVMLPSRLLLKMAASGVALGVLAGCSSSPATAPSSSAARADSLAGTIVVDAAASLTEAFGAIAQQFETAHPGVTITLNFSGSSALAQSIVAGAPVDVFAAASPSTMATVTDARLAETPRAFASNSLEIAVPPGNPGKVTSLTDFADTSRTIALCAAEVPCGAAAAMVFAAAGVTPSPDTLEEDVKAALTKVRLGEVDAALVYRTDVKAAGKEVDGIEFPESSTAVTHYPISALKGSKSPEVASAFVAFVLGDSAQKVLKDAGFATG